MKKVIREEIQVLQFSIWESILVLSLQHYYVDIWEKPMVCLWFWCCRHWDVIWTSYFLVWPTISSRSVGPPSNLYKEKNFGISNENWAYISRYPHGISFLVFSAKPAISRIFIRWFWSNLYWQLVVLYTSKMSTD